MLNLLNNHYLYEFSQSAYDFNHLKEIGSLKDAITTLNVDMLSDFFVSIDRIVPSFIENSKSFDEFKYIYLEYFQPKFINDEKC